MNNDSDSQTKTSTMSDGKVDDEFHEKGGRCVVKQGGNAEGDLVENRDVAIKTNLIKRSLESDHQNEKCDILPENFEKNSCDITPNDDESTSISGATTSSISVANNSSNNENIQLNEVDTTLNNNNSNDSSSLLGDGKSCDSQGERSSKLSSGLAFTIDFNEGKSVDNKKYREIVERFQNRQQQQQQQRQHRRGVSLSKLDDTRKSSTSLNNVGRRSPLLNETSPSVSAKPPLKQKIETSKNPKIFDNKINGDVEAKKISLEKEDMTKVTLRNRPSAQKKMSLDYKEPSKRHSWSPRSSQNYEQQYTPILSPMTQHRRQLNFSENRKLEAPTEFQPKSATLQRALETRHSIGPTGRKVAKTYENTLVVTAPLEFVRNSDEEGSQEAVSDAGTYTLDGDNYTEEEKERMSIDRLAKKTSIDKARSANQNRSVNQKLFNLRKQQQEEISLVSLQENENRVFYQDTKSADKVRMLPNTSHVSKISYLDKIKSRVKTIGDRTFHKNKPNVEKSESSQQFRKCDRSPAVGDSSHIDMGTFTSITACGVLNKNTNQETYKKGNGNRKNSLTKLRIDSSEYIQPKHNIDEKLLNSYTDYEKAKQCEYQLNIFSTVASYTSSSTTPPHTDDDDNATEEEPISIKTAPTKNDWIKEWARNARRRNSLLTGTNSAQGHHVVNANVNHIKQNVGMSHSYDASYNNSNEFGDDVIEMVIFDGNNETENADRRSRSNCRKDFLSGDSQKQSQAPILRPPISPTKIPSPVHQQLRARSSSVNRSFRNSNLCLDNLDTESYLEKTAAAISSLQKIHNKNNSPQSPLSPRQRSNISEFSSSPVQNSYETAINIRPIHLHKRNLSLDVKAIKNGYLRSNFDVDANYSRNDEQLKKRHTRHNSLENKTILLSSPKRNIIDQTYLPGHQKTLYNEQQRLMNKYVGSNSPNEQVRRDSIGDGNGILSNGSPIRRSSSFCNKGNANIGGNAKALQQNLNKKSSHRKSNMAPNALQKSISSSSFKQFMSSPMSVRNHNYNDEPRYYINNEDLNLNDDYSLLYSSDDSDDNDINLMNTANAVPEPPISHTRYNKAFLMRMEQNKQIASGNTVSLQPKGLAACPNTPELPRRAINTRSPFTSRASVPRDSSLSRMKQDLPNLVTAKKSLTQSLSKDSSNSTGSSFQQRVLPKYMDISKYKPSQGQNFLKRDESKSTLINRNEIRKSPSASGLCKTDTTRSSMRVKSAGAKPNTPAATKELKAREAELAMWRRRATYDPMKAAAEGKKKKEANKVAQKTNKYNDSGSVVLRSQSFHSGVSKINSHLMHQFSDAGCNRWTIVSTESSDEEEFGESS